LSGKISETSNGCDIAFNIRKNPVIYCFLSLISLGITLLSISTGDIFVLFYLLPFILTGSISLIFNPKKSVERLEKTLGKITT
jgi:hypothetical protein